MQATGANAKVIYDDEAQFGVTPGTPASLVLPIVSETVSAKRSLVKTNIIRGNRNQTQARRGNKDVSGSINTELNPYMGKLLKHLMGSKVTTGTGPYVHTLKVGALPTSLCFEKQFLDLATPEYFLYNGCRISKGSFEIGAEGIISFSLDFIGKKETSGTTSFHASPVDLGHNPFDAFEATIQEGGGAIAVVSNVKFDIDNQLENGVYVIGGGGERRAIPEGSTLVSGTLTALFEDMATLNKAINYTESSLQITLTRGTGLGSAGNESLDIKIPELVYEQASPLISGPKGIVIELPFAAFYDNATEGSSIQMILKNTQTTI